MKLKHLLVSRTRRALAAFSLAEVTVSVGLVGTSVGALMSGFATGFFTMQMARENLRATQIMLEKVETIRLYSWDQIQPSNNFVRTTFTNYYDPQAVGGSAGIQYTGTLTITNAPIDASYSNNMKLVTVRLNWTTGKLARSREFTSYVSRYGLQDYVY